MIEGNAISVIDHTGHGVGSLEGIGAGEMLRNSG